MVPLLLELHSFENWDKMDDFATKKEDDSGEMYKLQIEAILEHLESATTTSGFFLIHRLEMDMESSTWEEGSNVITLWNVCPLHNGVLLMWCTHLWCDVHSRLP